MTFTKSILLGSAAALAAVAGASAADLPSKKAAPAQYVKICDAAGAGYFYIPGSDTCLKISGYAELDITYNTLRPSRDLKNLITASAASKNNNTFGVDTEIQLDAVTKTSWGNLHTYIAFEAVNASNNAYLDNAYLEFAGITAGKHESFYHNIGGLYSGYATPDYAANLLAYTASFGGGLSATLSLEDSTAAGRTATANVAATALNPTSLATANGTRMPDLIGALRIKQGWGEASLIGGVGQTNYVNSAALNVTKTGYGVMGYVSINLPMLAAGDSIAFQAAWERNAMNFAGVASNNAFGTTNGYSNLARSVMEGQNQTGYSLLGYFKHNWTPSVSSEIEGSYAKVTLSGTGVAANYIPTVVNGYSEWRIGHLLAWHPVKNMEIGIDTAYARYSNVWTASQIALAPTVAKSNNDFRVQLRLKASF